MHCNILVQYAENLEMKNIEVMITPMFSKGFCESE